jgi:phosphoribosyl 1,2-cyclic phosphodiesterase
MCDCEYCTESDTRRRSGLLVESDNATIVLDTSPDLRHQRAAVGQPDVDTFLVTHHHYDHVAGLKELNHAVMPFEAHMLNAEELPSDDRPPEPTFDVFMTPTARVHLNYRGPRERLAPSVLKHGNPIEIGDISVVPFPVDHARPDFDTVGFAVHEGTPEGPPAVVYAPDMWRFLPDDPSGDAYRDAAVLFAEGSAIFRRRGSRRDCRPTSRAR